MSAYFLKHHQKFNTGEVDVVAAPAYAYKPLEIEKGLGSKGGYA